MLQFPFGLIDTIYIYFTTQEALLEEEKYCNASISIEPERIIPFNAVYMLFITPAIPILNHQPPV